MAARWPSGLIDCVSVGVDRMQRNFEPTGKRTLVLRRCFNIYNDAGAVKGAVSCFLKMETHLS
jgi:hypothetical protein